MHECDGERVLSSAFSLDGYYWWVRLVHGGGVIRAQRVVVLDKATLTNSAVVRFRVAVWLVIRGSGKEKF